MENYSFRRRLRVSRFLLQRFLLDLFGSRQGSLSRGKTDAVEDFTARSLSAIPSFWIEELLRQRGTPAAMPMYGYLFLIDEKSVEQIVERHLTEYDFGEDVERQNLIDGGWRVIEPTGLFALPLDGRILLGIDGVGYDFFEAHWEPLFDLLGYKWNPDD